MKNQIPQTDFDFYPVFQLDFLPNEIPHLFRLLKRLESLNSFVEVHVHSSKNQNRSVKCREVGNGTAPVIIDIVVKQLRLLRLCYLISESLHF